MPLLNLRTPVIRTGLLALLASLVLTGCGGTKVYDTTKTIVYRDSIYQVTDVQQIKRSITGIKSDDSTVNMTNMERRQIEDLLDAEDSVFVRMKFDLDGQELSVERVRQNQRLVVVLSIEQTSDLPAQIVVTDLLPAGLEIDNPRLVSSASCSLMSAMLRVPVIMNR